MNVWQAAGLSVALMAPSVAVDINPQAAATGLGRGVALGFLVAGVSVLLVAYSFVRLSQHFHHSGSVYGLVGAAIGPRSGIVAGWGLLGTYVFFGVTTSVIVGILTSDFLRQVGAWSHPPGGLPFVLAGCALVLVWLLARTPIRRGTNLLLLVECATAVVILVVVAVVTVRLLGRSTPSGQRFTLSVLEIPRGTSPTSLFQGLVFGFLSFAGFEAASTLGEEATDPRRSIPRAMVWTTSLGGVFFVVVTAVAMMGFGTDSAGVASFTRSGSLLGSLATAYLSAWVGAVVTLGATVAAFGNCLACTVGASRLLFALARDGVGDRGPGRLSADGVPARAVTWVVPGMALVLAICATVFGAGPAEAFRWTSTIGTLLILVVYALTTLGGIRLIFVQHRVEVPSWEGAVPLAALFLLGATLYHNLVGPEPGAGHWLTVVAFGWLAVALVAVGARPRSARRFGTRLTEAAGLRSPARIPDPSRQSRRRVVVLVGACGPIVISLVLLPFQGAELQTLGVAVLLGFGIAVSAFGVRAADILASLLGAVCYYVFFIPPYGHPSSAKPDISVPLMLMAISLGIGFLARRNRRLARGTAATSDYLNRIHETARLAQSSTHVEPVLDAVQKHLVELLRLRGCRFRYENAPGRRSRLEEDGSVIIGRAAWDVDRLGMPRSELELRVFAGGCYQGRFVLLPTRGAAVPLQARLTALTLADQAGVALSRLQPPWIRRWDQDR
ncbi:amino acid permease [Streptacidiphilus anmyonensis]|uniref:amino acid permease n=1 Tax=Streptacidiphilus anmyonensis TaxID=405782 RepID=UPI0007C7945B|nr:amino acid permease [Streptacidiphilus anmyonensis]